MSNAVNCPLCRSNNLLKVTVQAENDEGYLIEAYNSPGNYLVVPTEHVEDPTELPDTWWQSVKELIKNVPDLGHYNISLNFGQNAGQTVSHLHFWIIPRAGGKPASGRGLANLIDTANQE